MPGPVTYVTDAISNGRRESLNDYVKKLLALPPYISKCQLVRELFAPREGDFELDPRNVSDEFRLSSVSQQSSAPDSLSHSASRQSSQGQMNGNGYSPSAMLPPQQRVNHQRSQPSVSAGNGIPPGQANHQHQATVNRQPSSLTQTSGTSSGTPHSTPANSAPNTSTTNVATASALKIKVHFEDDVIAIRVASDISFLQLKDKLKDRLKAQDDLMIQYKDEPSGNYAELLSDRDLDMALSRNPKLALYVGYA